MEFMCSKYIVSYLSSAMFMIFPVTRNTARHFKHGYQASWFSPSCNSQGTGLQVGRVTAEKAFVVTYLPENPYLMVSSPRVFFLQIGPFINPEN